MELISALNEIQEERGYLAADELRALSDRLRVPLYRIQEIVSFYPHFRSEPPAGVEMSVCRDLPCALAGAASVCSSLRQRLDGLDAEVQEVSCLGRCERAPAALVDGVPHGPVGADDLAELARGGDDERAETVATREWRIDIYADAAERYGVYRRYRERDPDEAAVEMIELLKEAGLRGMGGAGFPTGLKWELVRKEAATPKYVICNADESEPGTFKDRVILEDLSPLVIEGMCLAGMAIGAERGWIYLRHEYGPEGRALERALADARECGVLGDGFDIEIFVSPGGYILGEETALLEALEDRRGEPRNKPPYPGQKGLWSRPTLINNVETLAMIPAILERGADWWREQGVRGHAGLKFIGVSGHVEQPGVFEIPMGTTVAELIDRAGGVQGGRALKAFTPGGASAPFLPASASDVEIDFDSLAEAGSMLGSAALIVLAEGTDMIEAATNVVRFFRDESCGKCVPCREGTQKVVTMLESILAGHRDDTLRELLPRLEETLARTSICGLGQVALNPIVSALEHWGNELDERSSLEKTTSSNPDRRA